MGVGARGGRGTAASVWTTPPPRHTHSTSTTLTHLDEQHLKRVEAQPIQVVLAIGVGPAHEQAGGAASGKQAGGERLGAVQRSPAPPPQPPLLSAHCLLQLQLAMSRQSTPWYRIMKQSRL